jgi:hypothetical protein
MHVLADQLAKDIAERGVTAVYEPELSRVWPKGVRKREQRIQEFAKEHGWRLRHYKEGLVAIFDQEPRVPVA